MWHYQWVLVEDFLPGAGRAASSSRRSRTPRGAAIAPTATPIIPFEFADAAFRYGHGQIRHRYRLQDGGGEYAVFPDLVGFGPWRPSTASTGGCCSTPSAAAGQAHGRAPARPR